MSVRRIPQIISYTTFLRYSKAQKAPYLQGRHKNARLELAMSKIEWIAVNGRDIQFTDEKKLNLDGTDGISYHWHELRTEHEILIKRKPGGVSVMISGAVCNKGTLAIE